MSHLLLGREEKEGIEHKESSYSYVQIVIFLAQELEYSINGYCAVLKLSPGAHCLQRARSLRASGTEASPDLSLGPV